MTNLVPCPNYGRCGSQTHDPNKAAYLKCLKAVSTPLRYGPKSSVPPISGLEKPTPNVLTEPVNLSLGAPSVEPYKDEYLSDIVAGVDRAIFRDPKTNVTYVLDKGETDGVPEVSIKAVVPNPFDDKFAGYEGIVNNHLRTKYGFTYREENDTYEVISEFLPYRGFPDANEIEETPLRVVIDDISLGAGNKYETLETYASDVEDKTLEWTLEEIIAREVG